MCNNYENDIDLLMRSGGVADSDGMRTAPKPRHGRVGCLALSQPSRLTEYLVAVREPYAHTRRFEVPGGWMPLVLILTLFCTGFAIGAANVRFPQIVGSPAFLATVGLALGGCGGAFAARSIAVMTAKRPSRCVVEGTSASGT
jgi:hypothetical protein